MGVDAIKETSTVKVCYAFSMKDNEGNFKVFKHCLNACIQSCPAKERIYQFNKARQVFLDYLLYGKEAQHPNSVLTILREMLEELLTLNTNKNISQANYLFSQKLHTPTIEFTMGTCPFSNLEWMKGQPTKIQSIMCRMCPLPCRKHVFFALVDDLYDPAKVLQELITKDQEAAGTQPAIGTTKSTTLVKKKKKKKKKNSVTTPGGDIFTRNGALPPANVVEEPPTSKPVVVSKVVAIFKDDEPLTPEEPVSIRLILSKAILDRLNAQLDTLILLGYNLDVTEECVFHILRAIRQEQASVVLGCFVNQMLPKVLEVMEAKKHIEQPVEEEQPAEAE